MDFDIVSKLFPNILTMLTQLAATAVIYFLYRKFLHEPVLNYLDARHQLVADELSSAESLKAEALAIKEQGEADYAALYAQINELKEQLTKEAHQERDRLMAETKAEIDQLRASNEKALEIERQQMHDELYANLLDVATLINERVLEDTQFNDDDMLAALQKEIDQHDYQH